MKISEDIVTKVFLGMQFDDVLDDLTNEIKSRNYLITRVNNIDNIHGRLTSGLSKKSVFKNYKIVEFCNLESCSQLISSNLLAGVFMPAKFIVYQTDEENKVYISFLSPISFANLFDSEKMMGIAKIMENDMHEVLEEIDF